MNLLDDIHEHYSLAHAEREQPGRIRVHNLLIRVFWDGINISDPLKYSPERFAVVATYGHLVVGVALLNNSKIARTMLYHLISLNPHRDIALHVSADNPAMLLYNRLGFKAEEFIVGFYEDHLSSQSRASMNAFRLRLRREGGETTEVLESRAPWRG
ncbi:hypothetical protein EV401DRAFT_1991142 [Pisolithus croceorrhizus]|nr:hypothetical protein EV401DRAFT_1991142 [Pisolithus croceorrhizus]